MALSDLAVFNETLWTAVTEILDQQVELFNAASNGGLVLASRPISGDYADTAFFGFVSGLVRRRDPYGSGAIAQASLRQLIETMVKVAAGTKELNMNPGQFNWIKENPEIAAATWAKQLAPQILADQLGIAIGALYAALSQVAAVIYDATALSPDTMTFRTLNRGAQKFGDRSDEIACWMMHSTPWFDLIDQNLQNGASLFTFGTVNVFRDMTGRPFVISDQPALVTAGSPNIYHTLGLTPGAAVINTNNDYDSNVETKNGDENIRRTLQAEWSYNVGIKGFTWDKANGGHAPTTSALLTATNWDKIVTSNRDLAGIIIETN